MGKITVIGLGPMGTALARTLLSAGHEVTVWNRSPDKAKTLVSDGANLEDSIADAIEASPVTLVIVNNYGTTRKLFESDEVRSVLPNRSIVQLCSGTPQAAVDHESWFREQGAGYLDGAILGSPKTIGSENGQILIAGNDALWAECQSLLSCLVGAIQFTGANIDSAKILDLAWLSQRLGTYMGVFQGLLLCKAAGVPADVFASTVASDSRISLLANTIHNETFSDPVVNVKVWKDALHHIQVQAQETGANDEVLNFFADKFQRAQAAGYEEEDVAALIKVFR